MKKCEPVMACITERPSSPKRNFGLWRSPLSRVLWVVTAAAVPLLSYGVSAFGQMAAPSAPVVQAAPAPPTDEATEVNKELSNPISSIWALQIQENTFFIHPGIEDKSSRNSVNVQFQPVLPLGLTDDWNLITRPVFQIVNSVPAPTPTGRIYQATGFGDTILATLLSPSPRLAGPWLLGTGPTFIFPTATTTNVGQKKWQLGPGGVFGYLGEHYIVGIFPQQWFSVGGNGSKQTSQMNLQYFASYFLPHGWAVGNSTEHADPTGMRVMEIR
jgi:hypothetical protein